MFQTRFILAHYNSMERAFCSLYPNNLTPKKHNCIFNRYIIYQALHSSCFTLHKRQHEQQHGMHGSHGSFIFGPCHPDKPHPESESLIRLITPALRTSINYKSSTLPNITLSTPIHVWPDTFFARPHVNWCTQTPVTWGSWNVRIADVKSITHLVVCSNHISWAWSIFPILPILIGYLWTKGPFHTTFVKHQTSQNKWYSPFEEDTT